MGSVDTDQEAIARSRRWAEAQGRDNVEFREVDMTLDGHDGFAMSPLLIGAWTRVPA